MIFLGSATLIMLFPKWFGFILKRIATATQTSDYLAIHHPVWLRPVRLMGFLLTLTLACFGISWDMFIAHTIINFLLSTICGVAVVVVSIQMVLILINTTPRKKRFLVLEVSNTVIRYCGAELLPGTGIIFDRPSVFPVIFIRGQWKIPHRGKVETITVRIVGTICFPVELEDIRQRIERTGLLMSPAARAEWEREREA
ncbi:hypothetical protein FQV43_07140 [Corynebacterium sp. sy039]|nr:hypothetical protein FQV43_07140 [Corynebacterium sp. sy039]